MKTIPVSLIVAGFLIPVVSFAQPSGGPQGPPSRDADGKRGGRRAFMEAWKSADKDGDGALSKDEFHGMPRIQRLPVEKRDHLFQRLDKDGDGQLAHAELGRMGGRPREGQGPPMQRLWELDVDQSGGVNFEEFKAGRTFAKLVPEKQQAVFRRLDTNGDGEISPKDSPAARFTGEGGKPQRKRPGGGKPNGARMEPRNVIRQLDKDGDGALSFDEFRAGPALRDLTEDEQEDRFEALDKNHDLKITAKDFPPPAPREPKHPKNPPAPAE